MKENSLISIIIVNWNGKKWLGKCLSSLSNQTYKKIEIIVVDNASTDDSIEYINNNFPKVRIIKNKKNFGFSTANNIAIKSSKGNYTILLNSDAWVEKRFVENLFSYYKNNNYDVIAPREKYYDKSSIYDSYCPIDFLGNPTYGVVLKTKKLFAISGACLFFKKDFYFKTQGLDEDFFMYFEDVDWFWRLQLLGKKFMIAEGIYFYHFGSGSSENGLKYNVFLWRNKNSLLMLLKNYSFAMLVIIIPIYFLLNMAEILFFLSILKPKLSYSYIQGWIFNLKNFKRTLKKRNWIQSHRVVSDLEIIKNMYFIPTKLTGLLNYRK